MRKAYVGEGAATTTAARATPATATHHLRLTHPNHAGDATTLVIVQWRSDPRNQRTTEIVEIMTPGLQFGGQPTVQQQGVFPGQPIQEAVGHQKPEIRSMVQNAAMPPIL